MLWFFGINHKFQSWGKSQCSWIWHPEQTHPFLRAPARFPITPSFLILLHKNKPFPKFLLNIMLNHLNNTEIHNPKEISNCQLKEGSYSPNILPDHSYSSFLLPKRSIILDFKIVTFIYIHKIRVYWQTANRKSAQS